MNSAKEKLQRRVFEWYDLFMRGQLTAYIISFIGPMTTQPKANGNVFFFDYKRNGKRAACTRS